MNDETCPSCGDTHLNAALISVLLDEKAHRLLFEVNGELEGFVSTRYAVPIAASLNKLLAEYEEDTGVKHDTTIFELPRRPRGGEQN